METIISDNYRIENKNGKVYCYHRDSTNKEVLLWETTANFIEYPDVNYNQPVSAPIDTNHKVKHYHDLDTVELYNSYSYISRMIERMDKQQNDPRAARNMAGYHTEWNINDLRSYCQTWLDDVRFRQDGDVARWWVFDRIKYFFKGQLKQRQRWLQTFGLICYDMCARLDAIDGGSDQPEPQAHHQKCIGF